MKIKKGDVVYTPGVKNVMISKVFEDEASARKAGFVVETWFDDPDYGVLGKKLYPGGNDNACKFFAAFKRNQEGKNDDKV